MGKGESLLWLGYFGDLVLRREVMQRERRKRIRTMIAPTKMPMTTQRRRPKIEVGLESCLLTKVASYTDILL